MIRRRLNTDERVLAIKLYFRENSDVRRTRASWRREAVTAASAQRPPLGKTIRALASRFTRYGTVADTVRPSKPSTVVKAPPNVDAVRDSVRRAPMMSTRERSKRLGISRSSVQRILRDRLSMRPYKLQIAHTLIPVDLTARLRYSRALLRLFARYPDLPDRLIMSDEAHFHLSGEVFNRQNVRFWGTENPRIVRTKDPHAQRLTVWCGICSAGIVGPYFYEDEAGRAQSVTGERYRLMLRDFVFPHLNTLATGGDGGAAAAAAQWWWWQQDGATSHTARETMRMLIDRFGENRIISRMGPRAAAQDLHDGMINWPSRSPDLSAADFFLWGYLKDRAYDIRDAYTSNNNNGDRRRVGVSPENLRQLRANIERETARLNGAEFAQLRRSVMREAIHRAEECERHDGRHLTNVLFKTTARRVA